MSRLEPLRVLRARPVGQPAFDTALSRAILAGVGEGRCGETLRLYVPNDVVAFSATDRRRPGFPAAARIAREAGFGAVLRLAGGRAALFHREGLAFAWSRASRDARAEIANRFGETAAWIRAGLQSLGVDARVGEVPGEYCPGAFSVNAAGDRKLAGIGQRIVRRAAHVGGVIAVGGRERVLPVLTEVYGALGYEFDPSTFGAVSDECGTADADVVATALIEELRRTRRCEECDRWDAADAEAARRFEADHCLD